MKLSRIFIPLSIMIFLTGCSNSAVGQKNISESRPSETNGVYRGRNKIL